LCVANRIKLIDQIVLPNANGGGLPADDKDKDDSGDDGDPMHPNGSSFKPSKVNPHFLMLYGHIMACGKSYQSAIGALKSCPFLLADAWEAEQVIYLMIVYYLRVYDLYPNDPLVCLSLSLAYTHRAMQRQTDNRHYQLAQAIAFLDGYRKLTKNEQEAQYNIARVFHQLGRSVPVLAPVSRED
jgi:general transcription factor 3C polypeptide 3 (transcription factor C subunit 4)